jgi:hypothetical protein
MDTSHLIESTTKNHLFQTLKQCHNHRVSIYYYVLNISIFLLFIVVTGIILYYCNKYKLSDVDKKRKMYKDQQYVLSKIRYFQEERKQNENQMSNITQLPFT